MKKQTLTLTLLFTLSSTILSPFLTSCGNPKNQSANSTNDTSNSSTTTETEKVETVKIATTGGTRPWTYTDNDDTLIGYEIDLLKKIDEALPQYEFDFEISDFNSIFLGLDAGQYDIGVNYMTYKKEREEKYIFSDYVGYYPGNLIVRKGYDQIKHLEDLGGKSTYVSAASGGGAVQIFLDNYNNEHPDNPIELKYSEDDQWSKYQDLIAGKIDFLKGSPITFKLYADEHKDILDQVELAGLPEEEAAQIEDPYFFWLFPQTDRGREISNAVSEQLKLLKQDGTVASLSEKYFGQNLLAPEDRGE